MPQGPSHRLKFVKLEFENTPDGTVRAVVELRLRPGQTYSGTGECRDDAQAARLRCASEATVDALQAAIGDSGNRIELLGVRAVKAFDATVVIVALAVHIDGEARRLVGSYLAEEDPTRGASIAVLNATNRYLGIALFSG